MSSQDERGSVQQARIAWLAIALSTLTLILVVVYVLAHYVHMVVVQF